jgi:hypothetical protein
MRSINFLFVISLFLICNSCYVDVGGIYVGDQEEDFDSGIQADVFISTHDDVQIYEQDIVPDLNTQVCVDEVESLCFDGIDNDCDGKIDEDCDMYCQPSYELCDDGNEHTEDWCSPVSWSCMNESLDIDDDGFYYPMDNCPNLFNPEQIDIDNDGMGDDCQRGICYDDFDCIGSPWGDHCTETSFEEGAKLCQACHFGGNSEEILCSEGQDCSWGASGSSQDRTLFVPEGTYGRSVYWCYENEE